MENYEMDAYEMDAYEMEASQETMENHDIENSEEAVEKSEYETPQVKVNNYMDAGGLTFEFNPALLSFFNANKDSNATFEHLTANSALVMMWLFSCCRYGLGRELHKSPHKISGNELSGVIFKISAGQLARTIYGPDCSASARVLVYEQLCRLAEANLAGKTGDCTDSLIRVWFTQGHDLKVTFGLEFAKFLCSASEYLLLKPEQYWDLARQCQVRKLTGNELAVILTMLSKARSEMVKHGQLTVMALPDLLKDLAVTLWHKISAKNQRSLRYILRKLMLKNIWRIGLGLCSALVSFVQKVLAGSKAQSLYQLKAMEQNSRKGSGSKAGRGLAAARPGLTAERPNLKAASAYCS